MKNSKTQLAAAMVKARADFAALVQERLQTKLAHAAATKASEQPPRQSIHYRTR